MPAVELQSEKYFRDSSGDPLPKRKRNRLVARRSGFLFRFVMVVGVSWSVFLFYKNQDVLLANIRDNSDRYCVLFTDLVMPVTAAGTNVEIHGDHSQTNKLVGTAP